MTAEKLKEVLDKHLKWLRNKDGGERADMNDYHFCPNCGADMREPPKEET